MNDRSYKPSERLGELASGTARTWTVTVDELLDGEGWFMDLDGPRTYLAFKLRDLTVIGLALQLLENGPASNRPVSQPPVAACEAIDLGQFGPSRVSLLWDNEDFPRCFIVIRPESGAALRLTLEPEDVQLLIEALRQIVVELTPVVRD